MNRPRSAAVVTWTYVAMFGIPAVPVTFFLVDNGHLPSLWGLFEMYGGPWASSYTDDRVTVLMLMFLGLTLGAAASGWLLWAKRRTGAVLNLVLLPAEAVFWIGFALPVPWVFGIARVVLVSLAWPSLTGRRRLAHATG